MASYIQTRVETALLTWFQFLTAVLVPTALRTAWGRVPCSPAQVLPSRLGSRKTQPCLQPHTSRWVLRRWCFSGSVDMCNALVHAAQAWLCLQSGMSRRKCAHGHTLAHML